MDIKPENFQAVLTKYQNQQTNNECFFSQQSIERIPNNSLNSNIYSYFFVPDEKIKKICKKRSKRQQKRSKICLTKTDNIKVQKGRIQLQEIYKKFDNKSKKVIKIFQKSVSYNKSYDGKKQIIQKAKIQTLKRYQTINQLYKNRKAVAFYSSSQQSSIKNSLRQDQSQNNLINTYNLTYFCSKCSKKYKIFNNYIKHMKIKHSHKQLDNSSQKQLQFQSQSGLNQQKNQCVDHHNNIQPKKQQKQLIINFDIISETKLQSNSYNKINNNSKIQIKTESKQQQNNYDHSNQSYEQHNNQNRLRLRQQQTNQERKVKVNAKKQELNFTQNYDNIKDNHENQTNKQLNINNDNERDYDRSGSQSIIVLQSSQMNYNYTKTSQQNFQNPPKASDIYQLSFMNKICFCGQRFIRYQNFYRHLKVFHKSSSSNKFTSEQQIFIEQVKRKASSQFQQRMNKYRGQRIQLRGRQVNAIHMNNEIFKNNNKINKIQTNSKQIKLSAQNYNEQDDMQTQFKKYFSTPYICDIDLDFQRLSYKLTQKQSLIMRKINKFFTQCVCHMKLKNISSLKKHIRYKHVTTNNLHQFYLQHYLHKKTNIYYCKTVLINSEKEKILKQDQGSLTKINLQFKSKGKIYSQFLLHDIFKTHNFLNQQNQKEALILGISHLGINIRYLGTSSLQRFRRDCRLLYGNKNQYFQACHIAICCCKKVIHHVESIRRHMRMIHGYKFSQYIRQKMDTQKIKRVKNQINLKNENENQNNNKKEYIVRSFCQGRTIFHKIEEVCAKIYLDNQKIRQNDEWNVKMYEKQANQLLNEIKRQYQHQYNYGVKDDFYKQEKAENRDIQ